MKHIYKLEITEVDEDETEESFYAEKDNALKAISDAVPSYVEIKHDMKWFPEVVAHAETTVDDVLMSYIVTKINLSD